ncbi:MIP/aquaporin family protein [Niallia nealsonii]|uniref:Aquaporin n=1 Tax=Niallia nealsonii TaxID=115979 RepID=A0A2N0Z1K6_9BACI|nr:MIP/aquaporin family protein [Niallia nealsonii]PKG23396.1 aquaporin [Niallia nealsonii]
MTAFLGEIVGTMILIVIGGGVVAGANLKKTFSNSSGWIVITIAWGLAVVMGAFAVGNISGAHLNPAVTIAFAISGDFPWHQVPGYILAQVIGGLIGAVIVYLHYLPHWAATEDPSAKLAVFSTSPAIPHTFSNLLSETIGTFTLVLGLLFIGANKFAEGLNPIAVGLLIVAIGMSLGGTTGYAINPARDLGPRIAHFILPIAGKGKSNWGYAWVPIVGPIMGASLAAVFYPFIYNGVMITSFWIVIAANIIILAAAFFASNNKSRMIVNKAA